VQEVALCKALERGDHPQDDHDLLAELVELREHRTEVEVDQADEVEELATLVTSMSSALMDLGLDPI
jgi:hypothetical protein